MRYGDADYTAALDALVDILKGWAREGRTHTYKTLSEALALEHRVHYRGRMMSLLLADACRRDSIGPEPMLSALVVNGSSRRPSGQFFELAVAEFHRNDPDWTWPRERDAVFTRYRDPVCPESLRSVSPGCPAHPPCRAAIAVKRSLVPTSERSTATTAHI